MPQLLSLTLIVLLGSPVLAAFGNFNSILIGEQASGMGGAYTAMWGDSSSSGFYNPASLVRLTGTDISASATLFNKYDANYGEGSDIVDAGERINRGFFRTVPSAIGNVYRYRKWAFGFNIVMPDYDFFAGNINSTSNEQSFLTYTDESLWSGVVASYKASPTESFGLTIYYTARSMIRTAQDRAVISPTHEIITAEEKSLKHNGIIFVLGYLADLSDKWTLGVSIRPPALNIEAEGSFYQSVTDTNNLPSQVTQFKNIQGSFYIPPRYNLGLKYQVNERLLFALDGSFYSRFGYEDMDQPAAADSVQHQDTWNAAIGAEYKFNWPHMAWRMGLFTNNSSFPEPGPNPTQRVGDHIDMWGFSTNINFLVSDQSSYTLGGFYTGGRGQSVQRTGNEFVVLTKSLHIFSLLISTSYKF